MLKSFILFFIIVLGDNLLAHSKVALLIGNREYEEPLKNPINDVEAIMKTLISIGFHKKNIKVLKNVSKERMERSLFEFNKIASKNKIAFIYFSGHGMQINNKNYLFPINTKVKNKFDLRGLVELDFLIQSASSAKYAIVLIDACRNNPLVDDFQKYTYRGGGSSIKKGLGQVKLPKRAEIIIGFSTEADSLAEDGNGQNSPYVKALIQNLKLNLDIRNVLGQVGLDVSKATNGRQNPILKSTLGINNVCLTGTCNNIYNSKKKIENIYGNKENEIVYENFEKNLLVSNKKYSWDDAIKYCKDINVNQKWRLATRDELKKISKSNIYTFDTKDNWEKWFNRNYGKKLFSKKSIFWSATSYAYSNNGAWFVDFSKKYEDWRGKDSRFFVICVKK